MGTKLNSKKIDSSVGGLVWVRRRNGSWWPGRIVGLHELSGDCLVSSKSGTPVKLLGREDASLDWYNLEKSKRVKAFRCGEFGQCIEKAKAYVANSNRKVVKYARREDAILHALKIESARETEKHDKYSIGNDGVDNWIRQVGNNNSSGIESNYMDREGIKLEGNSMQELSQSGLSFEDPNDNTHKVQLSLKKRRKTPNDSEDDGTGRTKRMRGLQDLVNGVEGKASNHIQTKRFVQLDCVSNGERKINRLSSGSHTNSSKHFLSLKRRRSQLANICETVKRKNRRRQLKKVLESSTMVSVPIFCDESASSNPLSFQGKKDRKVSILNSTELKKKNDSLLIYSSAVHRHSDSKNSDLSSMSDIRRNDCFDNLFDVPFVDEEIHAEGFSPVYAPSTSKQLLSVNSGQVGSISLRSEELNKYISTIDVHHNNIIQRTKKGTSKWKSKGKRKLRRSESKTCKSLESRRSVDRDGLSIHIGRGIRINTLNEPKYLGSIGCGSPSLVNREGLIHSADLRGSKFKSLSREKSVVAKSMSEIKSLPVSPLRLPKLTSNRCSLFTSNSRYEISDMSSTYFHRGSLFDVDLEVKASYSDQNVPLVSLMSKWSGKAIIGNPLTVEACDDGYYDLLVSSIDYHPTSSRNKLHDLPRESFSDQLIVTEMEVDNLRQIDRLHLEARRKRPVKHSTVKSMLFSKKRSKIKKPGNPSKKTRTLSSLSILPKQEEDRRTPVIEKLKGTVMTCIPLKLVFSRLSESLKCSNRMF